MREGKKEGRRGEKEGEVGLLQSSVAYLWCKRKYLVLQGIQFTSAENAHVSRFTSGQSQFLITSYVKTK